MKLVDEDGNSILDAIEADKEEEKFMESVSHRYKALKRQLNLYQCLLGTLPEKEREMFVEYACISSWLAVQRENDEWNAGFQSGYFP